MASLAVTVRDQAFCLTEPLCVDGVSHGQDGPYSAFAQGTIYNPWPVAVANIVVAAVLSDAAGAIIGGARARIDHLPAGELLPCRLGLPPELNPARVKATAYLDRGSRFA